MSVYYVRAPLTYSVQGFDEFMNVVVDEAAEVYVKDAQPRRELGESHTVWYRTSVHKVHTGRILLKGDNITLIQQIQ